MEESKIESESYIVIAEGLGTVLAGNNDMEKAKVKAKKISRRTGREVGVFRLVWSTDEEAAKKLQADIQKEKSRGI